VRVQGTGGRAWSALRRELVCNAWPQLWSPGINTFSINYQSVWVQKYYTVADPDLELGGKVLALLAFLSSAIFFFYRKWRGPRPLPLDLPLLYILFQTKLVKIESFSRSNWLTRTTPFSGTHICSIMRVALYMREYTSQGWREGLEIRSMCTKGIHGRVSMDTLNGYPPWPSINTQSMLDWHWIDTFIDTHSTLDQHLGQQSVKSQLNFGRHTIECQLIHMSTYDVFWCNFIHRTNGNTLLTVLILYLHLHLHCTCNLHS